MDPLLYKRARLLTRRHVRGLQRTRSQKELFKRFRNGRFVGRPIQKNSRTYKRCMHTAGVVLRKLPTNEKKGDATKYHDAMMSILIPCRQKCSKRYCMYCHLHNRGVRFPNHPVRKMMSAMHHLDVMWDRFVHENNLAPTRKVVKILRADPHFMTMLNHVVVSDTRPCLMFLVPVVTTAMILVGGRVMINKTPPPQSDDGAREMVLFHNVTPDLIPYTQRLTQRGHDGTLFLRSYSFMAFLILSLSLNILHSIARWYRR